MDSYLIMFADDAVMREDKNDEDWINLKTKDKLQSWSDEIQPRLK